MGLEHHSSRIRIGAFHILIDLSVVIDEHIDEVLKQSLETVARVNLLTVAHQLLELGVEILVGHIVDDYIESFLVHLALDTDTAVLL